MMKTETETPSFVILDLKNTTSILKLAGVRKVGDLTPKAIKLYRTATNLKKIA